MGNKLYLDKQFKINQHFNSVELKRACAKKTGKFLRFKQIKNELKNIIFIRFQFENDWPQLLVI